MSGSDLEAELESLHGASFAWALACCERRREEAEDVLQTSYLKLLDGRARFDGASSLRTFLFGVIRRTALEAARRRGFLARLRETVGRLAVAPAPPGLAPDLAATANALGLLRGRQREVLHLVIAEDLTIAEAAEVLGLTVGAARVHYERGKRRLRALLGKDGRR